LLNKAIAEAEALEACRRFNPPSRVLRGGLLGEEGSTEICQLDSSSSSSEPASLQRANEVFVALGEALEPAILLPYLGFATEGRSHALLHAARGPYDAGGVGGRLTESDAQHWLDQFMRQRLMALLVLGPRGGSLELTPWSSGDEDEEEQEAFEIQLEPGSLVLFRSDLLARHLRPEKGPGGCFVLSCFFNVPRHGASLSEESLIPPAWELLAWMEDRLAALKEQSTRAEAEEEANGLVLQAPDMPEDWRLAMNHVYNGSKGKQVCIRSVSCHVPAAWTFEHFGQAIRAGGDLSTEIPRKRWFWEDFYDPDPQGHLDFKSYTRHGVFMEGAHLFDNKLFGISNMEAAGMDPTQYLLMETAYESLQRAGFRKKSLMNSLIGVYIGQGAVEAAPKDQGAQMGGTGAARAVSCGRISFSLGMQGPCCALDAHGATAWACVEVGFQALRNQWKNYKTAIAGCVMLNLSPIVYVQNCAAGVLSPIGRCCSFDSSAAGYVKSEGASFACLETEQEGGSEEEEKPSLGLLCACEIGSLGRAATLGAPNGAAEQAIVAEALRSAELSPLNIEVVECFADGDAMSDAIEVSALARGLRMQDEDRHRPLVAGAVMSNIGFMREVAGFAQLLKLLDGLSYGLMNNNLHLHTINPLIDVGVEESSLLPTEALGCRLPTNFCGATSRGLGGTVTHAVVGVAVRESEDLPHVLPQNTLWPPRKEGLTSWPPKEGEPKQEPKYGVFDPSSWSTRLEDTRVE